MSKTHFFCFRHPFSRHQVVGAVLFIIFVLMLWLPSLFIPFWGDDYYFLTQAREARFNGDSWWMPFFSESATGFWRPLSMDTGWRFVEQVLGGNLLYAHLYSWFLCLLSTGAVALFAYQFARAMGWPQATLIGLLAAAMHAVHVASYLPLHWVAAMNSPTLVFFLCITLSLWVAVPRLTGHKRVLVLISLPILQILALFSKESAILIPALVLTLAIFLWDKQRYSRTDIGIWLLCIVICFAWLYFYKQFTPYRDSAYGIKIGENLVINSLSFIAWIFNIPREALRLIVTDQPLKGVIWALACFIPVAILYAMSYMQLVRELNWRQWLALAAFMVLAYGPYFVLAEQAYEYYAAVAIIIPLLLVARALTATNRVVIGLVLMAISSAVAVQGTRSAEYPAVISRAFWAENQLQWLSQQNAELPLVVGVDNPHQFAAMGVLGLSWRLNIPREQIVLANECRENIKRRLQQNADGSFEWINCVH